MAHKIGPDTRSFGVGPLTLDVEFCRRIGMTDDEMEDAALSVKALAIIIQRPAHRRMPAGRLRNLNKGCEMCTDVEDTGA